MGCRTQPIDFTITCDSSVEVGKSISLTHTYDGDLVPKWDINNKEIYIKTLLSEIKANYKNDVLKTLYFGGGTPSLMSSNVIEVIVEEIYRLYDVDDDVEITLEVNPKTVSDKKLSERMNVQNVIKIDKTKLKGVKRILILDDVFSELDSIRQKKFHQHIQKQQRCCL